MKAFIVEDSYTGEREVHRYQDSAEKKADVWRRANHNWHCVQKNVDMPSGVMCLCVSSKGIKECAAHHYARNVQPHSLEECTLGEVTVEEIDIY